jgi:hypothetical protein
VVSWQFLIIGTFAAVGAALAVGTLAALLRYRRTGRFPGEDPATPSEPVPRSRFVGMWLRVVIGTALAVYGVVSLQRADLL